MSEELNHAEAFDLACHQKDKSNLARCYLDLIRKNLALQADSKQYKWADAYELLAVDLAGVNFSIASDDIANAFKNTIVKAFNAARELKEVKDNE